MEKILVYVILTSFIFSGCATTSDYSGANSMEYYRNPSSQGYYEQVWGGGCEKCGRFFYFSAYQYDQTSTIQCPFCGTVQDIKMARNRYEYDMQQQRTAIARQILMQQYNNNQQNMMNTMNSLRNVYQTNYQTKQGLTNNLMNSMKERRGSVYDVNGKNVRVQKIY